MNAITTSILSRIQKDIREHGYSNYCKRNYKLLKLLSILNPHHAITVTADYDVYLIKM